MALNYPAAAAAADVPPVCANLRRCVDLSVSTSETAWDLTGLIVDDYRSYYFLAAILVSVCCMDRPFILPASSIAWSAVKIVVYLCTADVYADRDRLGVFTSSPAGAIAGFLLADEENTLEVRKSIAYLAHSKSFLVQSVDRCQEFEQAKKKFLFKTKACAELIFARSLLWHLPSFANIIRQPLLHSKLANEEEEPHVQRRQHRRHAGKSREAGQEENQDCGGRAEH